MTDFTNGCVISSIWPVSSCSIINLQRNIFLCNIWPE